MALRCFLFSPDEGTAELIRQALAELGVEGEFCPNAAEASDRIAQQAFQVVIVDWDPQPEGGLLLSSARDRKPSERPLTLAIVSDDLSVPKALQAGANSVLRKPIVIAHAKETLKTACDLIRARQEAPKRQAAAVAAGAAAGSIPLTSMPASMEAGKEKTLRAGEFLQTSPIAPSAQFITESDPQSFSPELTAEPVDPLQELEPMAASVASSRDDRRVQTPHPPQQPQPEERRGLEWYLKAKGMNRPAAPLNNIKLSASTPAAQPAPLMDAPATAAPAESKTELLGFEQSTAYAPQAIPAYSAPAIETHSGPPEPAAPAPARGSLAERLAAANQNSPSEEHGSGPGVEGFNAQTSYGTAPRLNTKPESDSSGEVYEEEKPVARRRSSFNWRGAIAASVVLAAVSATVAPQAPWHPRVQALWGRGARALHAWLNPQVVITGQAPPAHEDFGQAGDEYKMPVAENIPDATTDPSQIQVLPVVDPTKKTNGDGTVPTQAAPAGSAPQVVPNAAPGAAPSDGSGTNANPAQPASTAANPGTVPASAGAAAANVGSAPANPLPQTPQAVPQTIPSGGASAGASSPSAASNASSLSASLNTGSMGGSAASTPKLPPAPKPTTQMHYVSSAAPTKVPASLQSQMASMTPDAGGNKSPDAAMPSIEPVSVTESAERVLLADQPKVPYPANVGSQQGTVILQVLIGRDGTVQDAKFMQGSLAFARAAIDGVKQWKFKPYVMNGRPVSVQTALTLSFKPGQ
ncbi:MAG TPA: TonB family protein [Candidatus Sulfotelmatobacter sp.]|nr:TonB family protein [Candidatus Sulfotelmatobacter sp.]